MTDASWQMFSGPYNLPQFLEKLGVDPKHAEAIIYDWMPDHLDHEIDYDSRNYIYGKEAGYEDGYSEGYDDALHEHTGDDDESYNDGYKDGLRQALSAVQREIG